MNADFTNNKNYQNEELESRIQDLDEEIEQLDSESQSDYNQIENLLMLIKQEQYLSQVLLEKSTLLEGFFKTMQGYLIQMNHGYHQLKAQGKILIEKIF